MKKFNLKRSHLSQVIAIVLGGAFAASVQAAPVYISNFGTTEATIADAGYFQPGGVGLRFMGREFVNIDTQASNYWLNANGVSVAVADEVWGTNPLGSIAFGVGPIVSVNSSLFSGGSPTGWDIVQTVSIPHSGHVAVTLQLTNNTGEDARNVQWGVGIDPDQGGSGNNNTWNSIANQGTNDVSVLAVSNDGWKLTLHNTTSADADRIAAYIDPFSCFSPVDPSIMLTAGQTNGSY